MGCDISDLFRVELKGAGCCCRYESFTRMHLRNGGDALIAPACGWSWPGLVSSWPEEEAAGRREHRVNNMQKNWTDGRRKSVSGQFAEQTGRRSITFTGHQAPATYWFFSDEQNTKMPTDSVQSAVAANNNNEAK